MTSHAAAIEAGIPVQQALPKEKDGFYLLILLQKSDKLTRAEIEMLRSFIDFRCRELDNLSFGAFVLKHGRPDEEFAGRGGKNYITYTVAVWKTSKDWMLEQLKWDGGRPHGPAPLLQLLDEFIGKNDPHWHAWKKQHSKIFSA